MRASRLHVVGSESVEAADGAKKPAELEVSENGRLLEGYRGFRARHLSEQYFGGVD